MFHKEGLGKFYICDHETDRAEPSAIGPKRSGAVSAMKRTVRPGV
jgi:hypothetical protein